MHAKRFFFEKKKQKTFIHCRRHGIRTENLVPSETDKSFLVLFCKKERLALLRFQWVDLPGQKHSFSKKNRLSKFPPLPPHCHPPAEFLTQFGFEQLARRRVWQAFDEDDIV